MHEAVEVRRKLTCATIALKAAGTTERISGVSAGSVGCICLSQPCWIGEERGIEWRMRGSGPRVRGTRRRGSVDPCTDLRFDVRRACASSTQPKREECRRHHKSRGPSPRRLPTESRLVSALGLRQKLSDAAALDASASMLLFSTLRLHTTLRPRATRVMLSLLHGGASSGLLWREQLQSGLWSVVRSPHFRSACSVTPSSHPSSAFGPACR